MVDRSSDLLVGGGGGCEKIHMWFQMEPFSRPDRPLCVQKICSESRALISDAFTGIKVVFILRMKWLIFSCCKFNTFQNLEICLRLISAMFLGRVHTGGIVLRRRRCRLIGAETDLAETIFHRLTVDTMQSVLERNC